jgi:hypothetical protein
LAKRVLQNLERRGFRDHNIESKGVRVVAVGFLYTAFASTMMSRFGAGGKVRCHNWIVEK